MRDMHFFSVVGGRCCKKWEWLKTEPVDHKHVLGEVSFKKVYMEGTNLDINFLWISRDQITSCKITRYHKGMCTLVSKPLLLDTPALSSWVSLWLRPVNWVHALSVLTSVFQGLRSRDLSGRTWRRGWQPTPVFLPGESPWTGAWRTTVHGVAKSQTRLSQAYGSEARSSAFLSTHYT